MFVVIALWHGMFGGFFGFLVGVGQGSKVLLQLAQRADSAGWPRPCRMYWKCGSYVRFRNLTGADGERDVLDGG